MPGSCSCLPCSIMTTLWHPVTSSHHQAVSDYTFTPLCCLLCGRRMGFIIEWDGAMRATLWGNKTSTCACCSGLGPAASQSCDSAVKLWSDGELIIHQRNEMSQLKARSIIKKVSSNFTNVYTVSFVKPGSRSSVNVRRSDLFNPWIFMERPA